MRDTINILNQGIPVVGLVHEPFEKLARLQAVQLGVPQAPLLAYPQDLPDKDIAEVLEVRAREVLTRAGDFLLRRERSKRLSAAPVPDIRELASSVNADANDHHIQCSIDGECGFMSRVYDTENVDEFTDLAFEKGWTDGLPVLPPTEARVRSMLDHLGRDPFDIVGIIPPGDGIATLEKIAINACLAGCLPEYMPVIVAAVEAMLDPAFELNRVQCTTGGPAALAIISGPVVKALGLNYGPGVFSGNGARANAAIGRAIKLILWNIGLGRPGQLSQATFGHPAGYGYLLAERPPEDDNPWEELHVSAGLRSEDSAITMFPAGSHLQIVTGIGAKTFDDNLQVIADSICHLGNFYAATQKLVVVNPQAARAFHQAGWTKEMFRDALLERCLRPVRDLKHVGGVSATLASHWTTLVDINDDEALVPAMLDPHHLQILVAGGWASPSSPCLIIYSMHGEMVTRNIESD